MRDVLPSSAAMVTKSVDGDVSAVGCNRVFSSRSASEILAWILCGDRREKASWGGFSAVADGRVVDAGADGAVVDAGADGAVVDVVDPGRAVFVPASEVVITGWFSGSFAGLATSCDCGR